MRPMPTPAGLKTCFDRANPHLCREIIIARCYERVVFAFVTEP